MFEDKEKVLKLDARRVVYENIRENPGLHFRELQRRTNQAVGALQYHLDVLMKEHLIKSRKEGKFVRFFPVIGEQSEDEKITLSLLRQESARKIILLLLSKPKATNKELAEFLELSPSTISFHLQKLLEAELLSRTKKGREIYFSLTNPEQAKQLIIGHRKSFVDSMVDSFVELWEEI